MFLSNHPVHINEDNALLVSSEGELFHLHSTQSNEWRVPYDAITVYSADTGDVVRQITLSEHCLLYTSDAADD